MKQIIFLNYTGSYILFGCEETTWKREKLTWSSHGRKEEKYKFLYFAHFDFIYLFLLDSEVYSTSRFRKGKKRYYIINSFFSSNQINEFFYFSFNFLNHKFYSFSFNQIMQYYFFWSGNQIMQYRFIYLTIYNMKSQGSRNNHMMLYTVFLL